ncbi:MAG: M66 family metalloprotease [Caldilineaceae bacterium]
MLIPVAYQPNGQGAIMRPDLAQNNQGLTNLQNLYPVANVQTTLHSEYLFTGVLSGNGWSQLLNQLTAIRNRELGGAASTSKVVYYGIVPQAAVAGLTSFTAGIGWVGGNILTSAGLEQSVGVAAHEVGHNLGLNHAPCGVSGDPDYPFADARIGDVGVDVYLRQFHSSADKDFMSYCQPIWVSAYHYNKMLQVLAQPALVARPSSALASGLLIAGSILSNTVSGQLSASVPISTTQTEAAGGAGAYRVELRDANGVVQYSHAFTPAAVDTHTAVPDYGFSFVAPLIANLGRIQLWKGNTLLTEQIAALVPPELTASLSEATNSITVNWQTSSPDGTPVTVALRYSADNGLSWRVLALNLTGTSFTIDKRNLPAGSSGQLEVIAGNTTKTRTKALPIGAIANKAPVVSIAGPGAIQQYKRQPLLLQAVALDIEDGYLQGNRLVWTDEHGQVLGVGETLSLPTGLTLGAHTLTLTATDSAGAHSVDTVQVTVTLPQPGSLGKSHSVYLPLIQH